MNSLWRNLAARWARFGRLNPVMAAAVTALCVIGVFFIYSACFVREDLPVRDTFRRQILWAVSGLAVSLVIASTDYREMVRWAWVFYSFCLAMLGLVLLIGVERSGARRWLFGMQPAEFTKLSIILLLAHRHGWRDGSRDVRSYLIDLGLMALPMGLIARQPDVGTALVFVPTVFAMLFVARVAPRAWCITIAVGILAVALQIGMLMAADRLPEDDSRRVRLNRMTGLSEYQRGRLLVYLFPERDPHGMAWNKRQSEIAVGSGGLLGKGFLRGNQNILGFLPRTVAPTDFIYAVVAEETGFVGSVTVLSLFGLVLLSGLSTALLCREGVGRLLCVGVVTLIFVHVFVNVAMTIGLVPITGLPLPFLSYGGSFMWTMLAAIGLMQSVAIHGWRRSSIS